MAKKVVKAGKKRGRPKGSRNRPKAGKVVVPSRKGAVRTFDEGMNYMLLRITADALYDHMDVRMRSKNRVRSLVRMRLLNAGFDVGEEDDDGPLWSDKELLAKLDQADKGGSLTIADKRALFDAWTLADRESEIEKEYEAKLTPMIKQEPIYGWLNGVKGMGVRNMTRLLVYFGYCERFDTVGKMWAYAGLSVVDGRAPGKKRGEKLGYNPKAKTAMLGVLAKSLIMANGVYKKQVYEPYKKRIMERGCCDRPYRGNVADRKGKMCREFPGHAERMAVRYMCKQFLANYYVECRKIKGLPVRPPYAMEFLGHTTVHKPLSD